jgi:hypothetical protein
VRSVEIAVAIELRLEFLRQPAPFSIIRRAGK